MGAAGVAVERALVEATGAVRVASAPGVVLGRAGIELFAEGFELDFGPVGVDVGRVGSVIFGAGEITTFAQSYSIVQVWSRVSIWGTSPRGTAATRAQANWASWSAT